MNDLYKKRHGIPVDNENQSIATKATNEMIRQRQELEERRKRILDFYKNGQQKDVRI